MVRWNSQVKNNHVCLYVINDNFLPVRFILIDYLIVSTYLNIKNSIFALFCFVVSLNKTYPKNSPQAYRIIQTGDLSSLANRRGKV
jgi:hypothetical protein